MASLNKTTLIGNLGNAPEMRVMPNGKPVASFSVATTDKWKDRESGELKEKTEWHRVVAYDRLAEIVGEYAKKGRQVYVEGKLQTRKWADQGGVDHYTTEIIANDFQLLGSKPSGNQERTPAVPAAGKGGAFDDMDDDVPY